MVMVMGVRIVAMNGLLLLFLFPCQVRTVVIYIHPVVAQDQYVGSRGCDCLQPIGTSHTIENTHGFVNIMNSV